MGLHFSDAGEKTLRAYREGAAAKEIKERLRNENMRIKQSPAASYVPLNRLVVEWCGRKYRVTVEEIEGGN